MRKEYEDIADVILWDNVIASKENTILKSLISGGFSNALVNSVASGFMIPDLSNEGARITSLVHELPESIVNYSLEEGAEGVAGLSHDVIFPAPFVMEKFIAQYALTGEAQILPQGLYKQKVLDLKVTKKSARKKLGVVDCEENCFGCWLW